MRKLITHHALELFNTEHVSKGGAMNSNVGNCLEIGNDAITGTEE
jgi:hypothetical protein